MHTDRKLELESVLDGAGTSRFQVVIVALCTAVTLVDGLDTQLISFAAPAIATSWRVPPASFGLVFGVGLFGGLVGAVCTGVVADRIGRKPTLMATVLLFGVASLATPLAGSMVTLGVVRFVTGLGVGGALPGAIALSAEYTPRRARATVAALTVCGIPLGSVLGSVLAAQLIPAHGWRSVFLVGGAVPLLMVPLLGACVPESVRFLALKHDRAAVAKVLARMGVLDELAGQVRLRSDARTRRAPLRSLFTEGRALGTSLLSAALFLTLLMAFLLVNWIPLLAVRSGIGTSAAILGVGAWNVGGILGSLVIGRLSDRLRPGMVISFCYGLGALAVMCVGQAGTSVGWLLSTAFVAGFFAIGAQLCTVSLLAIYYDTRLRATGVGWGMGCGRVGGIIGPVVGGWLVAASVSTGAIFVIAGLVCAACAVTVFALGHLVLRAPTDDGADLAVPGAAPAP
ncbi:MAG: MFS transporter [Candidatus Dormibacteraeota bacterium]|nr:MFS transporter [Candidatus Dormibacteraeota bacterium]